MKKLIYSVGLIFVVGSMASCNEDPVYYELKDNPDQMHIKASAENVVFNKGLADQDAITDLIYGLFVSILPK